MTKLLGRLHLLTISKRGALFLLIGLLSFASLLNTLQPQIASAAQLSPRKVTISTSQASATGVSYTFDFTLPGAIDVEGIIFEFCTTPLGTCTLPPGMDVDFGTAGVSATQTFTTTSQLFAEVTSTTGDCTITGSGDTKYCVNRTMATAEAADPKQITVTDIINPSLSTPFTTAYVRISLYDNSTFSNSGGAGNQIVHNGTVAAGITQRLTTTGRVQERLAFCVGAIDDGATLPVDCSTSFPTTTSIDLGVIDNASVVRSPVEITATNGANDDYGIAMVNTNASSGVVVTYFPEAATSVSGSDTHQLRSFRVLPTDCNALASSATDQCFTSADSVNGEVFSAGTERFGLQVPCIDTTQGSTTNLANVPDKYNNVDDDTASATNCEGSTGDPGTPDNGFEFGFLDTGTPDTLATSNTVVEDEIIKLRFGATASATTPTGTYFVVTTYIATPTF